MTRGADAAAVSRLQQQCCSISFPTEEVHYDRTGLGQWRREAVERIEVSGVAQKSLLQGQWRAALDKWHARMNFGSEKVKAKLKVFNHMAIWSFIKILCKNLIENGENNEVNLFNYLSQILLVAHTRKRIRKNKRGIRKIEPGKTVCAYTLILWLADDSFSNRKNDSGKFIVNAHIK